MRFEAFQVLNSLFVFRVPIDLPDVSYYPVLFEALAQRGWSDEDMEKLAGRNLIRVFKDVERVGLHIYVENENVLNNIFALTGTRQS